MIQNSTGYVGVTKRRGKYVAKIKNCSTKKWEHLGVFSTPQEASEAFEKRSQEIPRKKISQNNPLSNNSTGYVGVFLTPSGKYQSNIWNNTTQKSEFLGNYDTPQEASKVREQRKKEINKGVILKRYITDDLPNEIWKDIIGYEGSYQISNFGRVKILKFKGNLQKIMNSHKVRPNKSNNEYFKSVNLLKNGLKKDFLVHRLVAEHFIYENLPNDIKIIHVDGNTFNNQSSNLQISTHRECHIRKLKNISKTGYIGVDETIKGRYRARITIGVDGAVKNKYLGTFDTPQEASEAYQLERQKQLHKILIGKDTKILEIKK